MSARLFRLVGPALLVLTAGPLAARQEQESAEISIDETLRVTSVRVLVGSDKESKLRDWATGRKRGGPTLRPDEVAVRLGDTPVPVAVSRRVDLPSEPARIVLFFDAPTSDPTSYHWAARQLAAGAHELAARGEVQIVVADPDPRTALGPTRDGDLLEDLLSNASFFAHGEDAQIPALREEFVGLSRDLAEDELDLLARHFAALETRIVLGRQDILLDLLDRLDAGSEPAKLLFYVSQGFDRSPVSFYRDDPPDGEAALETDAWMRTLAGYGWTCLPLVHEDRRALLRRGLRVGKWRFHWTSKSPREEERLRAFREPLAAGREAERNPDRADALAELAKREAEAGSFEAAADNFLRAIHHYYGDPRTRERQAAAWLGLSRALRAANDVDASRAALANALELDPDLAESEDVEAVFEGGEMLTTMARETGGWVLGSARDVSLALAELGRRQTLGFDLPEPPAGQALPLVIDAHEGKGTLRHVRWVRSGTPARMARARLRRYVEGLLGEPRGSATRDVLLAASPAGVRQVLLSDVPPAFDRVLVALADAEGAIRVVALEPANAPSAGSSTRWAGSLAFEGTPEVAAVYLEAVASGDWSVEAAAAMETSSGAARRE